MLARKWTRVQKLAIAHANWRLADMHSDLFLHLATWSNIHVLELYDVQLPSIATLGRLVCALPNLNQLDCYDVRFSQSTFSPQAFQRNGTNNFKLSTVAVRGTSLTTVLNFFIATGINNKIVILNLYDWSVRRVEDIQLSGLQTSLQKSGMSVHHLDVSLILSHDILPTMVSPEMEGLRHLDLSWNTELGQECRQLVLHLIVDHEDADFGWVSRSLTTLTSTALKFIELVFDISLLADLHQIDTALTRLCLHYCFWIDEALSCSINAGLSSVGFRLKTSKAVVDILNEATWSAMVVTRLSRLERHGVLRTSAYYT